MKNGGNILHSWRLLDTGPARGSFNMALDEALFLRALDGDTPPTIRFYSWSPPALSLGYAQPWDGEFDAVRCRDRGVEVYRRITGGRAVLHDDEVTYSVVRGGADDDGCGWGFADGVLPVYLRIGTALAAGLETLGLAVKMAPPLRRAWGGAAHNPVCFSSASGYEITCQGNKIVGSALKRHGKGFLCHGSILLGGHGERLADLLGERYRAGTDGNGAEGAARVGVRDLTRGRATYGMVVGAMMTGFANAWNARLVPAAPDSKELALAARLEKEKYLTPDWNLRRKT